MRNFVVLLPLSEGGIKAVDPLSDSLRLDPFLIIPLSSHSIILQQDLIVTDFEAGIHYGQPYASLLHNHGLLRIVSFYPKSFPPRIILYDQIR